MPARKVPIKLTNCIDRELQCAWVKRALRNGHVLTDSGLWLAGVNSPAALIAELRKSGLKVITTRKRVVDAADQVDQNAPNTTRLL